MNFFLGTHQPQWLSDERFEGIPLFISRRRLSRYANLPRAATTFALDSGGFSELQMHGRWMMTPLRYAIEVLAYAAFYGKKLLWIAPQDWMCEPIVVDGGVAARGVRFAGTKLSVAEHQRLTVANFVELRRLLKDRVIPVLQGWSLADYWRCQELYAAAGVRLEDEPVVGLGSVCRRQSTAVATRIVTSLASDGLRLHGFGFKKGGLRNCRDLLSSADSMAWSDTARKSPPLEGHERPGKGRSRGHKNCANCAEFALGWRDELLADVDRAA